MKDNKRKAFTTTIDVDVIDKLKKIAGVENRSQARTLEVLIRRKFNELVGDGEFDSVKDN